MASLSVGNATNSKNDNHIHAQEDWEVQRDAYKATGDDAFRRGDYTEAIAFYSNALELDPTHVVLLSNRSAAFLKAGLKSKSLQDAKACVDADPKFAKGYSRLASAQQSLGRWQMARESYEMLLLLDPSSIVARKGLEDCISNLKEIDEEQCANEKGIAKPEMADDGDLLDDFFAEVETTTTKKVAPVKEEGPKVIVNQKKELGTPIELIERLLAPNYQWRNLNPFYVLDLPHDSTEEEISRRYKALSLLLHPDKCRMLDRAKEAYDEVQHAKALLSNEDKLRHVRGLVEQGIKIGRQVWKDNGRTEPLTVVQDKEVQRIFAQIELKRREVERNERKHEERERRQEEEEMEKGRRERKFDKDWRDQSRVDKRIGNWRDFQEKKKPKI